MTHMIPETAAPKTRDSLAANTQPSVSTKERGSSPASRLGRHLLAYQRLRSSLKRVDVANKRDTMAQVAAVSSEALLPVVQELAYSGVLEADVPERCRLGRIEGKTERREDARQAVVEVAQICDEIRLWAGLPRGAVSTMSRELILAMELGGLRLSPGAMMTRDRTLPCHITFDLWIWQAAEPARREQIVLQLMGHFAALEGQWGQDVLGREVPEDAPTHLKVRGEPLCSRADAFAYQAARGLGMRAAAELCRQELEDGIGPLIWGEPQALPVPRGEWDLSAGLAHQHMRELRSHPWKGVIHPREWA